MIISKGLYEYEYINITIFDYIGMTISMGVYEYDYIDMTILICKK